MPKTEAECFGMFSRRVYIMRADCCNAAMSTERKPERGEGREGASGELAVVARQGGKRRGGCDNGKKGHGGAILSSWWCVNQPINAASTEGISNVIRQCQGEQEKQGRRN